MTPRFLLYGMGSPNVRKITLMLEEVEQAYEIRLVRVFGGEQFEPQFRALNPLSKVPVLVDRAAQDPSGGGDGYAVFESGAILIYLAETFGRLLPAAGTERYEALKWLFAQTSNVGPMFGQYNHFRMPGWDTGSYSAGRYRSIARRLLDIIEERLGHSPYLGGAHYTIADVAMHPWSDYVDTYGLDWADFPNLARWRAAIAARPAAERAETRRSELALTAADGIQAASKADLDRFWWREETPA